MSVSQLESDEEDVAFIDELPEYLKCPICLCCLKDPYQTPCGHRFCKECIIPILSSRNNVCPNDRTQIDSKNTFPDNAVRLQINNLRIRCPHEGCDWRGTYSDRHSHQSRCTFASTPCDLCHTLVRKTEMTTHLAVCPKHKVQCEFCGEEVSRDECPTHQRTTCPEFPLPCQYSCSAAKFPRKLLSLHYSDCPSAPVHCSMAAFGCSEQVPRGQLASHLLECAPRHAAEMAALILKLQTEVESLKTTVQDQAVTLRQVDDTLYPSAGQFTWRIDELSEKIKSAQARDPATSVMYSPPFYSSEAGYKLCLCIYPAGDHNQGYLSLYFVLMKGKFDEILQWPFQKRVTLSLLNCRGGSNVIKEIQPDPRLHYFHRPENPRNVGYGYPKFMALQRLLSEEAEHVQNGAIFLRCKVFN